MLSAKARQTGKPAHSNSGEAGAGAIWERQRWNALQAEGSWKHCFGEAWHFEHLRGDMGVTIPGFPPAIALCHNNIPLLINWLLQWVVLPDDYNASVQVGIVCCHQSANAVMGWDRVQPHLRIDSGSGDILALGVPFVNGRPGNLACRQTTSNWSKTQTLVVTWHVSILNLSGLLHLFIMNS